MSLKKNICFTAILCLLAWDSMLYAQEKAIHMERILLVKSGLNSSNPSLLQAVKNSILLKVKTYYHAGKGDFVNYYSPDQYYQAGVETESYKRMNDKVVVYGFASYTYNREKNGGKTSFLDPYQVPFNFVEKDDNTKSDRLTEQYHLKAALSYKASNRWALGAKIDYKTVSFVKLKDMRNTNNILDLLLSAGTYCTLTNTSTIGMSYNYSRYIENMEMEKYGLAKLDYFALIDHGAFMGLLQKYGKYGGTLSIDDKKPWVDMAHNIGIQYSRQLTGDSNWLIELNYEKGKGHFGNESDHDVIYMRHNRNKYLCTTQLAIAKPNKTHVVYVSGHHSELTNNEQLFQETREDGGLPVIINYGELESLNRKSNRADIRYHFLWGDTYLKAPWQLSACYVYNQIQRKASYYPYYRKQDINWHTFKLGIAKRKDYRKIAITLSCSCAFTTGNGGEPSDGTYNPASSTTATPDYLNNLLYKEKEYLTAKQLNPSAALRTDYNYNPNMDIYLKFNAGYTKPFSTEYLNGSFASCTLSAGVAF